MVGMRPVEAVDMWTTAWGGDSEVSGQGEGCSSVREGRALCHAHGRSQD